MTTALLIMLLVALFTVGALYLDARALYLSARGETAELIDALADVRDMTEDATVYARVLDALDGRGAD